jgi:hypothetical protein
VIVVLDSIRLFDPFKKLADDAARTNPAQVK